VPQCVAGILGNGMHMSNVMVCRAHLENHVLVVESAPLPPLPPNAARMQGSLSGFKSLHILSCGKLVVPGVLLTLHKNDTHANIHIDNKLVLV
jgi:hypothetical protein